MITEIHDAPLDLLLRVAHTADFDETELERARLLLDLVFGDGMSDADWEHCLGGVHVLAFRGHELVGHAALVQRRLLYAGSALRAGYVEGVVVHPAHRRRGVGGRSMAELERIIARAFELGALAASDVGAAMYRKRGWLGWRGPVSALTPRGLERTPEEDGGVYVLEVTRKLDVTAPLAADYRDGDIW
jgi:aminoglycoside 2'-N-acetyltransferase I